MVSSRMFPSLLRPLSFQSLQSNSNTSQSDEPGLEPTPPPVSNVIADGALAMIAGADTTATAISSLFYLLLSHPEKLEKLRREIDEVYPRDEDESVVLESGRHGRLGYLNACLYVAFFEFLSC